MQSTFVDTLLEPEYDRYFGDECAFTEKVSRVYLG